MASRSSPLGLSSGRVRLAEHDPSWARAFAASRSRLEPALADLDIRAIEHVGSTSVPDLPAKPILDIAVEIAADVAIEGVARALVALGYVDRGDRGGDGGHLFALESAPGMRVEHLHVVRDGDGLLAIYLGFRERLRTDPDARRRYLDVKRGLAAAHPEDRDRYTAGKAAIIRELLEGPSD